MRLHCSRPLCQLLCADEMHLSLKQRAIRLQTSHSSVFRVRINEVIVAPPESP